MVCRGYSERYPAIGETHALSVLAGCINHARIPHIARVDLFDMVGLAAESVDELIHFVESTQPDILGISVTYGTFDFLKATYGSLRRALPINALVVFGGPLASYLPDTLLHEIDGHALVVTGEGENAFVEIVRRTVLGGDIFSVTVVSYVVGDQVRSNPRVLTDVTLPRTKKICSLRTSFQCSNGFQLRGAIR